MDLLIELGPNVLQVFAKSSMGRNGDKLFATLTTQEV